MAETWPSLLAAFALLGAGALGIWAWEKLLAQLKDIQSDARKRSRRG